MFAHNFTSPTVPHTVIMGFELYVQYATPLLFAFAVRIKFKGWLRNRVAKHDRKAMLRKNYGR